MVRKRIMRISSESAGEEALGGPEKDLPGWEEQDDPKTYISTITSLRESTPLFEMFTGTHNFEKPCKFIGNCESR